MSLLRGDQNRTKTDYLNIGNLCIKLDTILTINISLI